MPDRDALIWFQARSATHSCQLELRVVAVAIRKITPLKDSFDRTRAELDVGYDNTAELALTDNKITAVEAKEMGLVARVLNSKQELYAGVAKIAEGIESLSVLTSYSCSCFAKRGTFKIVSEELHFSNGCIADFRI
jgi:hypothetical protein